MTDELVKRLQEIRGIQGIVMTTDGGEVVEETVGAAADRVAAFIALLKGVADTVGQAGLLGELEHGVLTVDDTRLLLIASELGLTGMLLDPDSSPLLVGKSAARVLSSTS